jgi:hypothetical protein
VILLLHNRYRTPGGEERAVDDLAWLIRHELGEEAEVLQRDSAALGSGRAALGLLAGGLRPQAVADAVRRTGARVVHAHNLQPAFGWRALAAAREAGADVRRNDFLDPWGNRVQVVDYRAIQFAKTPEVLAAMGLSSIGKSAAALREMDAKGFAPGA